MTTLEFSVWRRRVLLGRKDERLGQAFCNDFIKGAWPELFYEQNETVAYHLIKQYLIDNQYWPNVPAKIDPEYQAIRRDFIYTMDPGAGG